MALWKAECYLGSNVGTVELTVSAASSAGARQMLERTYGAQKIYNLREIEPNGSTSSDASGAIAFTLLLGLAWFFINFTPWILMVVFGGFATWISQLILGTSLEDATKNDDNPRIAIILILALLAGGFGFYKGHEIQQDSNKPKVAPQAQPKVQPQQKSNGQYSFES